MPDLSIQPNERVTFSIAYEDEHLLVIEKRAGLVTQPGLGHESDSLLNGLFVRHGPAMQKLGKARDFGLLHRLDRETSGLLVVALTARAYDPLREAFESRTIRKFYWAVCAKSPKSDSGVINRPLAETTPRRLGEKKLAKISSGRGSREAVTAFRVLATSELGPTLVECRPLTGRLHQVRVHLESIGAPIMGDGLYAPPNVARAAPRLALHAHRLAFAHPVTSEPVDVRSPWPRDLRGLLKRLRLPRPDLQSPAGASDGT